MKKYYIIKVISWYKREVVKKCFFRTRIEDIESRSTTYLDDRISNKPHGFIYDCRYFTPMLLSTMCNATRYKTKKQAEKGMLFLSNNSYCKSDCKDGITIPIHKREYELIEIYEAL